MNKQAVQNRIGSKFTVTYPDFPSFEDQPHHITITQEVKCQDVVELSYTRFNPFFQTALRQGVPVVIKWSNDKTSGLFSGYVMDVTPVTQQSLYNPTIVRCISASFPSKDGGTKIWKNKTAAQVVTDIAKSLGLNPVVTEDNVIFSQQSFSGHTYWEKLQEIAYRKGYVCQLYGIDLHFHPLDKMIDMAMTVMPVFSYFDTFTNPWSSVLTQTLDYFKPTTGDYFSHASNKRTEKSVSVVDPLTGKMTTHVTNPNTTGKSLRENTRDPLFKESLPNVIAGTAKIAASLATAQAQLSRFSIQAKAKGQGDPRVAPYRTVEVNGTGPVTDNFWVVDKAVHFLTTDGRYTLEFWAKTDGTGRNKASATRPSQAGNVPTRNLNYETTTGTTVRATSVKLNAKSPMISQASGGWKVTPRRWVRG